MENAKSGVMGTWHAYKLSPNTHFTDFKKMIWNETQQAASYCMLLVWEAESDDNTSFSNNTTIVRKWYASIIYKIAVCIAA